MEGWIKLHRKILSNDIVRDSNAWIIFTWLLLKVDRVTGSKKVGRYWASEELGMKSGTFYDALQRLEKKHKVATLRANNKYTEVQIVNWLKYQSVEEQSNSTSNINPTTRQQPDNTLQEVEKKELRNIPNGISYGNEDINILIAHMKEKMKLPLLDDTVQVNRQYANLAIKKFGGREKVQVLIDVASTHSFWSTRVTSFKTLYYKGVSIISSNRDTKFGVTKL